MATVEEFSQRFGCKNYYSTDGDTLPYIVRKIYNSDSDNYINILKVLNPRVNWSSLKVGVTIKYLDPSVVTEELY